MAIQDYSNSSTNQNDFKQAQHKLRLNLFLVSEPGSI